MKEIKFFGKFQKVTCQFFAESDKIFWEKGIMKLLER